MKNENRQFPSELFVVTSTFNKGESYERDFILDSTEDRGYGEHRARTFRDYNWPEVRLRRVRFTNLQGYERFLHQKAFDRYKLEDWQSDAEAY